MGHRASCSAATLARNSWRPKQARGGRGGSASAVLCTTSHQLQFYSIKKKSDSDTPQTSKALEDAVHEAQRDAHSLVVWSWDTDIGTDIACGGESARTAVLAYALARDFVSDVGTKR
jgi:hypothetical protein